MVVNENVLGLIGNTPMVDVSQLSPNPDVRIIGKLESQNPFGSVKDRIAKHMIEQAEKDGRLKPGQTIMEPSSGNTGIALAAIAQMKGYPIKILMPTSVSIERRQMLEVFGAELILTPGEEGSNGAVRRAMAMADEHPEYCFLYQYGNDNNPLAHYEGTGPEIWRDCPEITHFVAGLGTSGTLMGTGRFLKEQNPDIKVIAIEPPLGERVEGLRNLDEGYIPPVFDTWGGMLTHAAYREFSLGYIERIVRRLQRELAGERIPNIVFTKGGGLWLEDIAAIGCDAVGLDWTIDIGQARARIGNKVAIQGNLDPSALLSTPEAVVREAETVLARFGKGNGHVFNLGHGISQFSPPENVAALVSAVREKSAAYH